MVDLRKNVAKQFQKQAIKGVKDNLGIESNDNSGYEGQGSGAENSPINWQNYNYPPLFKLIHYSTDQLNDPFRSLAKKMHACAILILVNTLLNHVPIFSFASIYSFSAGYYAICQAPSHSRKLLIYRITQVILIIAWFIFSIIRAGPFDGWTKISVLSECNLGFSIFLAVLYRQNPFTNEIISNQTQEDDAGGQRAGKYRKNGGDNNI
ncbi:UNKNOWN [Stylonychia lemnae]|uniref:Uncharacterized protein n=1 Tax=Stylonychia lemnae TaxID=5949 RepID=A0A077ZRG3_STYLE|nr:UNKNOWN [Stylonychia lemnae]|eukprot:CDW72508.1 UNKNOWN [Stylonychia lemnae]